MKIQEPPYLLHIEITLIKPKHKGWHVAMTGYYSTGVEIRNSDFLRVMGI